MEDQKQNLPDPDPNTTTTTLPLDPSDQQPLEDSFDDDWEIVDENLKSVEVDFKSREDNKFKIQPPSLESTDLPPESADPGQEAPTIYTGKLRLVVLKASDLKKKDFFQKADPYIVVNFGSQSSKSKKVKNTLNPEWNHEVTFDIDSNSPRDINVQLFDWDRFGKDDSMGSVNIGLDQIISSSSKEICSRKLEGSQSGRLHFSLEFDGEITRKEGTLRGVKDLRKYLKEDTESVTEG